MGLIYSGQNYRRFVKILKHPTLRNRGRQLLFISRSPLVILRARSGCSRPMVPTPLAPSLIDRTQLQFGWRLLLGQEAPSELEVTLQLVGAVDAVRLAVAEIGDWQTLSRATRQRDSRWAQPSFQRLWRRR